MDNSDTIAWLVPSYGNNLAMQATQMRHNAPYLCKSAPAPSTSTPTNFSLSTSTATSSSTSLASNTTPYCGPALRLAFSHRPKSLRGFTIGTDPTCDIILPKIPGISRRHACLTFDADSRLVLTDTSKNGTAVWYDHDSNGDRRGFTWVLSSGAAYGFPDQVRRIVVDVQGVRFQVVVNRPLLDVEGYARRVDDFLLGLAERRAAEGEARALDVRAEARARRWEGEGFVKYTVRDEGLGIGREFLWNTARPWDPIIPVSE